MFNVAAQLFSLVSLMLLSVDNATAMFGSGSSVLMTQTLRVASQMLSWQHHTQRMTVAMMMTVLMMMMMMMMKWCIC